MVTRDWGKGMGNADTSVEEYKPSGKKMTKFWPSQGQHWDHS